jgi:hypothetical protein
MQGRTDRMRRCTVHSRIGRAEPHLGRRCDPSTSLQSTLNKRSFVSIPASPMCVNSHKRMQVKSSTPSRSPRSWSAMAIPANTKLALGNPGYHSVNRESTCAPDRCDLGYIEQAIVHRLPFPNSQSGGRHLVVPTRRASARRPSQTDVGKVPLRPARVRGRGNARLRPL